jgi:ADP-dependent NAD(P)H-hydrate dehydratase
MTADLLDLLPERPLPSVEGDKRNRGTVVIVGGDATCPGGAVLAGVSALRVGAGRVQLVVHPSVAPAVAATFPEAFVVGWDHGDPSVPEPVAQRLEAADAVLVGPGLRGNGGEAARVVASLVPHAVPLLVDATAVDAALDLAAEPGRRLVVAPNDAEARSLLDVGEDGEVDDLAGDLSAALGGRPTAVRGVETIVVDGDGGRWSHCGDAAGLGTAGSGDVLAGVAIALLGRDADPLTALAWSVALHARAGTRAGAAIGAVGFLAREVADELPRALADLDG